MINDKRAIRAVSGIVIIGLVACNSDSGSDDSFTEVETTQTSTTCEALLSAFDSSSEVVTASCEGDELFISSPTGLPYTSDGQDADRIMVGVEAWIQRLPIPFGFNWSVPTDPAWQSTTIESTAKGPIAVAVDGVPIFHYERRPDVSTALSNYTRE